MKLYRRELLFATFLFCFFIFILASVVFEPLKYLKYTLPVLLLTVLIANSKRLFLYRSALNSNRRFLYLTGLIIFYLVAFAINIFKGFNSLRFYEEFYFVLSPLFFALFLVLLKPVEDYSKAVYFLFWAIAISFVAEKFSYFLEELKNPTLLLDALLTSELPTESNFAFQFGLFAIVFLEKKNKVYSIASLVLLLLSFKRIAIAGVLVFVLLLLFKRIAGRYVNLATNKVLIVISNCFIVLLLFLFFKGTFDQLIEDRLGVSSNFLTQGRYNIYQDIFAHFGSISLWGFGLGSINSFLSSAGYELVNLHSDILKVFFELGPFLFVGWVYFFHKWANTFLCSCLAIYMNILFFTDNVLIYFDVMFVFYMLMLYSFEADKEPGLLQEERSYRKQKIIAPDKPLFMNSSSQPLVSVIMPTYNTGKYIMEAIQSVLDQTYSKIELIIVNDGSTDHTSELVRSLPDKRIRYFELEKNRGRGYARNYAVSKCNGEYIAICDADDINLPERLSLQVAFLEEHKDVDIVSAQLLHFSERSKPAKVYHFPEAPSLVRSYFQKGTMGVAHAACMLRRKCFDELRYEDSISYNVEDFELFLRLNRFHKMASLGQSLVLYRNDIAGLSLDQIKHHNLYHHYSIYVAHAKLEQAEYMSFEKWSESYKGSLNHQSKSLLTYIKVRAKNVIKHLK